MRKNIRLLLVCVSAAALVFAGNIKASRNGIVSYLSTPILGTNSTSYAAAVDYSSTLAPSVLLQPYISGLSSPMLATNAGDGRSRLFIAERAGIIKVVQPGANVATDFMNITGKIRTDGERGLLGLAFHPQFAANGYFFVHYSRITDGATIISRFSATNNNTLGDSNSEKILLTVLQPFNNHNGGSIAFRNDNGVDNLYIGLGDGGSANDPGNRAQNVNDLLGKFLRITPNLAADPVPPYTVPDDNPYVGSNGADEIYAIGFRNPFRWSFDRGGTRQLWAGDVGQGAREEVDIVTRGGNFGWRIMEGTGCTPGVSPNCTPPAGHIPPVFEYAGGLAPCRSVTGGYVYRGALGTFPNGAYVYADYCTSEISMFNNNVQTSVIDTANFNIVGFGEDEDGELYVCNIGAGTIQRLAPNPAPSPTPTPTPTSGSISGTVSYSTTPSGQPAKFVPGVLLTAAGSIPVNTLTNNTGAYLLSGFGSGAYTVTPSKSGDVNGISALDASRVAQHAAGLIVLSPNQILAGDATNNGTLSALDASRIAQTAAGITNPGIAGQWKFVPDSKTYQNVANSISGEDFEAILVGDVTGNWAPPAGQRTFLDSELSVSSMGQSPLIERLIWNRNRDKRSDTVLVELPATATTDAAETTLPISIGDTTGKGLVAYEFTLEFDPNVLNPTIDPVSTSDTLSSGWSVVVNSEIPGQITVIAFSTEELAASGTLLNLKFRVVGAGGGATPLQWRRFELNEVEILNGN